MEWIRRRPTVAAIAGVVAVLAVLVLVFVMSGTDTPEGEARTYNPSTATPTLPEPTLTEIPAPPATPTATKAPTAGGGTSGSGGGLQGLPGGGLGGQPIQSGDVNLPGLAGGGVAQNPPKHRIQLLVTSKAPIGTVGYYIPYSPDKQSGTLLNVGPRWSLRTVSYGSPDYARLYLRQGARPDAPITCKILVDGRVVYQKSTDGPYSLLICQG